MHYGCLPSNIRNPSAKLSVKSYSAQSEIYLKWTGQPCQVLVTTQIIVFLNEINPSKQSSTKKAEIYLPARVRTEAGDESLSSCITISLYLHRCLGLRSSQSDGAITADHSSEWQSGSTQLAGWTMQARG